MGDDREAGLIWLQDDQAPVLMRVTVMLTHCPPMTHGCRAA